MSALPTSFPANSQNCVMHDIHFTRPQAETTTYHSTFCWYKYTLDCGHCIHNLQISETKMNDMH